jgi:hypothetical protein
MNKEKAKEEYNKNVEENLKQDFWNYTSREEAYEEIKREKNI